MEFFRKRNKSLIYAVNFSGLYMKSIETFISNRFILFCLKAWTSIPVVLIPVYLGSSLKYLIWDDGRIELKLSVIRRVFAFTSYFLKNIFFLLQNGKIEDLIDFWDSSFKEEFYEEERREVFNKMQARMKRVISVAMLLNLIPALFYTVPPLFSKTKALIHPTGLPYKKQSPDFEFMVSFDFFRVNFGVLLSSAFDCILIVLLAQQASQLIHLKKCLRRMLNEVLIDETGALEFRHEEGDYLTRTRAFYDGSTDEKVEFEKKVRLFRERFRIWVKHHQQTLRYFERVKELYGPIATLQLIYVVCYTCFMGFHVVKTRPSVIDLMVVIFIASGNVIALFWWCRLGDLIDDVSSRLMTGSFDSSWFILPADVQKDLLFVAKRGRIRLGLNGVIIYPLNSFTYFELFSSSLKSTQGISIPRSI